MEKFAVRWNTKYNKKFKRKHLLPKGVVGKEKSAAFGRAFDSYTKSFKSSVSTRCEILLKAFPSPAWQTEVEQTRGDKEHLQQKKKNSLIQCQR